MRPGPGRSRSRTPARSRATPPSRRSSSGRMSIPTRSSTCSTRSPTTRSQRSRAGCPRSCRSRAWGRIRWRSSIRRNQRGRSVAAAVAVAAAAVTVAIAAAAVLAGCGGSSPPPPRVAATSPGPVAAPTPVRHAPAPRTRGRRRSPRLRHLQAELVWALRPMGGETGALVYDLSAHATLFSLRSRARRPPASVEKLYTSVALLRLLGPDARLHTALLGTGGLLRGDGDPTFGDGWYDHVYEHGYGSTVSELVAEVRRAGIRRVTGRLYGDGSRFDSEVGGPATGGKPDTPDYGGEMSALVFDHGASSGRLSPPAFAAHELALTLRAQHVWALAAQRPARTPRGAHVIATVASPRLPVLLKLMDVPSDDLFADLLTKQLGHHFLGEGTLEAGAVEIRQALASMYGLEPVIHDGSGLDRADRTSPDEVVSLLRQTWGGPVGRSEERRVGKEC